MPFVVLFSSAVINSLTGKNETRRLLQANNHKLKWLLFIERVLGKIHINKFAIFKCKVDAVRGLKM